MPAMRKRWALSKFSIRMTDCGSWAARVVRTPSCPPSRQEESRPIRSCDSVWQAKRVMSMVATARVPHASAILSRMIFASVVLPVPVPPMKAKESGRPRRLWVVSPQNAPMAATAAAMALSCPKQPADRACRIARSDLNRSGRRAAICWRWISSACFRSAVRIAASYPCAFSEMPLTFRKSRAGPLGCRKSAAAMYVASMETVAPSWSIRSPIEPPYNESTRSTSDENVMLFAGGFGGGGSYNLGKARGSLPRMRLMVLGCSEHIVSSRCRARTTVSFSDCARAMAESITWLYSGE